MLADSGPLFTRWEAGGPFIGSAGQPHVRVTVEVGWTLGEFNAQVGDFKKPPLRYVQTAAQTQVETEIPNVLTFTVVESVDQDAATLSIAMLNQKMNAVGVPNINADVLGNPGYYTWSRGESAESLALWGQTENEWHDVLVPNALLRSYEGYGGTDKTIAQAVADGNIAQTGVWLIDDVNPASGGRLDIAARNLAKLVIDQPLYPPLVPEYDVDGRDVYPLRYARFFHIHGTQTETIFYGDGGAGGATGRYIRGIEYSTRTGQEGYWMVGSDGGVFSYGYLDFYGSLAGVALTQPIVGMTASSTSNGYWLASADGGVFAFGDAQYYGSLPGLGVTVTNIVAIERSRGGNGYLMAGADGGVFAFGDAVNDGNGVGTITGTVVGFDVRQTGSSGYWLCTNTGHVYAFGGAGHFGGLNGAVTDVVGFASTPTELGYYLIRANGAVNAYGDAVHRGDASALTLNDPMTDLAVHPSGNGYWLAAQDGGVFTYGPGISFYGSLPGPWVNLAQVIGNYSDYSDIVKDLLRWSGLWLYDGGVDPQPHGNIEMTGIYNNAEDGRIPEDLFDKKGAIEAINKFKATVGFIFWFGAEGEPHFESPNWWSPGNFLPNGTHTNVIPVVHELENLNDYAVGYSGSPMRSRILIASYQPDANVAGTVVTDYVPQNVAALRGLHIPLMWVNQLFVKPEEQQIMAELIDLHINMQRRLGSVRCPANPLLQINDQVRIIERETSETFVHYVRTIQRTWDKKSGKYEMQLTTNWLGDDAAWAITFPEGLPPTNGALVETPAGSLVHTAASGALEADTADLTTAGDPAYWTATMGPGGWVRWECPTTGSYRFDTGGTSADAGDPDTVIAIYPGGGPYAATDWYTANDDSPLESNQRSAVALDAIAGRIYDVYVAMNAGLTGTLRLNWEPWAEPTPIVNLLEVDSARFESSVGAWTAVTNCSVARVTDVVAEGTGAMEITCTTAGQLEARLPLQSYTLGGADVVFMASVRSRTTRRKVTLEFVSNLATTAVATVEGASDDVWERLLGRVTGASMATGHLVVKVTGALAGEKFLVDRCGLGLGPNLGWWTP